MKKNIILLIIVLLGVSSCYKDNSAVNYKMINPLRIELGNLDKKYYAFALDTLQISPIVYKEGVKDEDLEFYWEISGNLIVPTEIGNKMSLKTELNFPPEGNSYKILYRVTDKETGLYIEEVFEVTIQSPFGTGLLVCDSHDGVQSDISLIMGRNFDAVRKKGQDTIMYNLFSRVNERKVNGIITATNSNVYGVVRSLAIATMNSIERVDPFDFTYMDGNAQIFYLDPGVYKVSGITYLSNQGVELLINDGKIHPRSFQGGNKLFSYYLLTADLSDYNVSKMVCGAYLKPLGFDELGGRVVTTNSWNDAIVTMESQDNSSVAFKPSKLKGFKCLQFFTGMGNTSLRDYHMILEDKISKRRYSYVINATNGYDSPTKHGLAKEIIDLDPAKCPGIEEAVAFCATENQAVIYYATKNTIYAVGYPTWVSINVTEEYSVPEGEEITGMLSWTDYSAGGSIEYANPDPNAAPDKKILETGSQNRMIIITSYNPTTKEGFIRTVAVTNVGSGRLEKNRELHNEFKGFGKISNISFHKR